jgi:hypothetical protein
MTSRGEYEAAYFTLLRAIEERDALLRYHELLEAEGERLDAFTAATHDVDGDLPRKLRRPLAGSTKQLLEAVGRRRAVVLDELARSDERIAAAEAFVRECEEEVASLRG